MKLTISETTDRAKPKIRHVEYDDHPEILHQPTNRDKQCDEQLLGCHVVWAYYKAGNRVATIVINRGNGEIKTSEANILRDYWPQRIVITSTHESNDNHDPKTEGKAWLIKNNQSLKGPFELVPYFSDDFFIFPEDEGLFYKSPLLTNEDRTWLKESDEKAKSCNADNKKKKASKPLSFKTKHQPSATVETNIIRQDKDTWLIQYNGTSVHFPHLDGFLYIQELLTNKIQIHCIDLWNKINPDEPKERTSIQEEVDVKTRNAIKLRCEAIRDELNSLENNPQADEKQIHKLTEEKAKLMKHLRDNALSSKSKQFSDTGNTTRTNIQRRIKDAEDEIRKKMPTLGKHLDNCLKTGFDLRYSDSSTWQR